MATKCCKNRKIFYIYFKFLRKSKTYESYTYNNCTTKESDSVKAWFEFCNEAGTTRRAIKQNSSVS